MKIEDLTPEEREWFEKRRTKCEVWSRVMGYHRPVEFFNKGKQAEFAERKLFKESLAVGSREMREID